MHCGTSLGVKCPHSQLLVKPRVALLTLGSRRRQGRKYSEIVCGLKKEDTSVILQHPSPHGSPIVDYLLIHNKFAPNLSPADIEEIRDKEKVVFASLEDRERIRRLRIAFANRGRQPWNLGISHSPGMSICKFQRTRRYAKVRIFHIDVVPTFGCE